MAEPKLEKIIDSLQKHLAFGKAHLAIAKGLLSADPVVLQTANVFFSLTLDGSLQLSQICAAKLYDKPRGAVTVRTLLFAAEKEAGLFANGTPAQVRGAICRSKDRVKTLHSILESIEKRRNEILVHLDPQTVINPQVLLANAALTVPQISTVFEETGKILNEIGALYSGVTSDFNLFGWDDYEMALKLIADAKCAQADKYEKEFHQPAPFARPRSCS